MASACELTAVGDLWAPGPWVAHCWVSKVRVFKDLVGRLDNEQGCQGFELFLCERPEQLESLPQVGILHRAGPGGEPPTTRGYHWDHAPSSYGAGALLASQTPLSGGRLS